jgi:hypothetical protein
MLIKVKTLTGKEVELDIEPTDRVERIKEKVGFGGIWYFGLVLFIVNRYWLISSIFLIIKLRTCPNFNFFKTRVCLFDDKSYGLELRTQKIS